MHEARLTTQILASTLIRRANTAGGSAMVLRKGDPISGTLLIQISNRGQFSGIYERMMSLDGIATLVRCGPAESSQHIEIKDYISRRSRSDPDLWLVELDVADGERLAAETLSMG